LITTVPNTGGKLHYVMPHRTEIEDALVSLGGAYKL
jgi:hypothetical protein